MTSANPAPSPKFTPAATILRQQLSESSIIVCPGVYDGFSARLALNAGFKNLYMTGAGTTMSVLGSPDLALITLPEMLANASMIASLDPTVPLIADADTGFGGPLNVARTVKAYINANIAGLHIEDQTVSKRCGHLGGKQLVSTEEFVVRIRAAVAARAETGRDIVIIARTDAHQSFGFDESIKRLKAAIEAGAEVAFFEGIETEEEMERACKELAPTPCLLNMIPGGSTKIVSAARAQELGYKIQIWPVAALTGVFQAVKATFKQLKETGFVEDVEHGQGTIRDMFLECGMQQCAEFDAAVGGTAYKSGV